MRIFYYGGAQSTPVGWRALWTYRRQGTGGPGHSTGKCGKSCGRRAERAADVDEVCRRKERGLPGRPRYAEGFASARLANEKRAGMRVIQDLAPAARGAVLAERTVQKVYLGRRLRKPSSKV